MNLNFVKKIVLSAMSFLCIVACDQSNAESTASESNVASSADQTLIVFFSRADENYKVGFVDKGNTELMAEMIAQKTGAKTFKIDPVKPYPKNYKECTEVASTELENKARPEIKEDLNIDQYKTIFLGYPIWWGDMPMPVYTFLEKHDFTGKTIIPFNTHEGSGLGVSVVRLKETTKANVTDGFPLRGSDVKNNPENTKSQIDSWLAKYGY